MFSSLFKEQNSHEIEYKGKKINAYYTFNKKGEYILRFKFISSSSNYLQAIIIHWDSFEGQLFIDGVEAKKPKKKFPQTLLNEKYTPKQFEIKVILNSGEFRICNASDLLGDEKIWRSLYGGCAMLIEEIGKNHYRFNCNDHEIDDDFDDLIFEMEIINCE